MQHLVVHIPLPVYTPICVVDSPSVQHLVRAYPPPRLYPSLCCGCLSDSPSVQLLVRTHCPPCLYPSLCCECLLDSPPVQLLVRTHRPPCLYPHLCCECLLDTPQSCWMEAVCSGGHHQCRYSPVDQHYRCRYLAGPDDDPAPTHIPRTFTGVAASTQQLFIHPHIILSRYDLKWVDQFNTTDADVSQVQTTTQLLLTHVSIITFSVFVNEFATFSFLEFFVFVNENHAAQQRYILHSSQTGD